MKKLFPVLAVLVLTSAFVQADVINDVVKYDMAMEAFNPCNGEPIFLEGTMHVSFHMTVNDNNARIKEQFNPSGLQGVGLISGAKYNGVGNTKFMDNSSFDGFPFSFGGVNNYKMVSQGDEPNWMVHENWHFTVNANGDVTGVVENYSFECRG